MPTNFDAKRRREILLDSSGYRRALRGSIEEARVGRWLGSVAEANLHTAVFCMLVGLDKPARQLLEKARLWVTEAIETDERPQMYDGGEHTNATRYHTLAMCNWLLDGEHDSHSLQRCVEHEDGNLAAVPSLQRDPINTSLLLPSYINARAYERALEIFAGCPKLSPPTDLNNIRNEAGISYVLCRHRLGLEFSEEETRHALYKFLNRQVNTLWLGRGHSVRAAEWMKISYWNEGDDPRQTVLKCYDHMPNVEPPKGLLAEPSA